MISNITYIFAKVTFVTKMILNERDMKNIGYNDYWHNQTSDCVSNCTEEESFTSKIKSCAVCMVNFVSTAFKAIFKM